ncbi:MAG: Wzz/FepE/Etk N-terminal domain-containing protein, partial [Acidobacteriota bacterium]|nr:Wzz/FepE/Etk N-terminal domain-containing protein [Acidobacteriota bacterium]
MKPSNELIKREREVTALEKPNEYTSPPHSYNYGVDPNAEAEVHLLDYWRAVRKRLWLVLSAVALLTTLSILYVARKPDVYEASSRVQVDLENNAALLGKTPFFMASNDPVYFNTQLQILTSPGLMRRVVKSLDLEHNPDFFKGNSTQKRSTWQTIKGMAGFKVTESAPVATTPKDQLPLRAAVAAPSAKEDLIEAKRLDPFVGAILSGLRVDPVKETRGMYKETRLIDISFTHGDPEVASKVVNAIAETYVANNVEKRSDTNISTADFLQKRVAELQENIRTDEERLLNYARNNKIISLDASQNTVVERLAGLNSQLLEAENARIDAESKYNAARNSGAAAAMAEADPKQTGDAETKLA